MYIINKSALVTHSAQQMFELVDDVASYDQFLPWCGGAEEHSRSEDEVIASVTIAYKDLKRAFTTRNQRFAHDKLILSLVDGPFSELCGVWTFLPLGESTQATSVVSSGCKISLKLEFAFSNILVEKMIGSIFKSIANSMVDSFCARADELYGQQ